MIRITANDFFNDLNVDRIYFLKKFKQIGVNSSFIFLEDDLKLIRDYLPIVRYRSLKVAERANQILDGTFVKQS